MKKTNTKGFTLLELLAVITIMGVLMIVGIPAIIRIIENSRKDIFIDTAKQYTKAVKKLWIADDLQCEVAGDSNKHTPSATPNDIYFVPIHTENELSSYLLEQGRKSPWGNRDIKGYVLINVQDDTVTNTTKTTFYPVLTDGIHGINTRAVNLDEVYLQQLISDENIIRSHIQMSGAEYNLVDSVAGHMIKRTDIEQIQAKMCSK